MAGDGGSRGALLEASRTARIRRRPFEDHAIDARIHDTLNELEREGVLDPERRAIVAQRIEAALAKKPDRTARVVSILAGMGAVLVGAGILYLAGFNWRDLARATKLSILFATWLALHVAGYRLGISPGRHPKLGHAFTAIGVLSFGAAIGLIAQIYHLTAKYPNAVLVWWLLNLPFVFVTGSTVILLIVEVLFVTWAFWHAGVWLDESRMLDRHAVAALPLFAIGLGALLASFAGWAAATRRRKFALPLSALATLLALLGAYLLSIRDFQRGFRRDAALDGMQALEFLAPFACAALASLIVLGIARWRRARMDREALVMLALGVILAITAAALPDALPFVGNAVLLGAVIAWTFRGVREARAADVNLALCVFAVCVVTRYIEYLWDKLEGAYAFIGLGALLLALGWLVERRRRKWLAGIRARTSS